MMQGPCMNASVTALDQTQTHADLSQRMSVISSRRSIRRYRDTPVMSETIELLLTAAISAPSAHNRQPWRFRLLRDGEKEALAAAMGARLRHDRLADGDPLDAIDVDITRSYARISGSPAIIVMCLSMEDMDHYTDMRRAQAEYLMAVQSVAMAGQNLLLAAHATGLGACWVCAPLFCPETVRTVLNLPDSWQPQGMITIGYPAEHGGAGARGSLHLKHSLEAL